MQPVGPMVTPAAPSENCAIVTNTLPFVGELKADCAERVSFNLG